MYIVDYTNATTRKTVRTSTILAGNGTPDFETLNVVHGSPTTAAINQLVLVSGSTWTAGTYILYGVK
jgi:hypothetical protein